MSRMRVDGPRRRLNLRAVIQRIRDVGGPALAVLATISFVSSLGISIMLPLLPLYGLSLGASPLQLGLMTSGFAVANGVAQFASGFAMDRFGARRFIVAGIGTYAIANVLIATAPTAIALIGYRVIAGLGGGVNMVATRLYIAQTVEQASLAFFQHHLGSELCRKRQRAVLATKERETAPLISLCSPS
jgi:MFS family permease